MNIERAHETCNVELLVQPLQRHTSMSKCLMHGEFWLTMGQGLCGCKGYVTWMAGGRHLVKLNIDLHWIAHEADIE